MFSTLDCTFMTHALRLAEQGLYTTTPNPRVGCVIVKNNQIIGQGAHIEAGEPHAEVFALRQAGVAANGADIYITLEPCSHTGKTPPCVDAVIAAQPKRVIVAMQDPNPLVAGRGVAALREAGVEVLVGVLENEAKALNIGFVSRMMHGMPYVRSKVAASLDGKTALNNGKSQWITGEHARLDVQHWRAQSCAIITGIGTVLADNPNMTVRLPNITSNQAARQPLKVIVDSCLRTPVNCKMLDDFPLGKRGIEGDLTALKLATTVKSTPAKSPLAPLFKGGNTLIAYAKDANNNAAVLTAAGAELLHLPDANNRVDLTALLQNLAQREINEVLLEAGQGLNGAFLQENLIDELLLYYAPKLLGTDAQGMFAMPEFTQMQQAIQLKILDIRQVGLDIRLRASPIKSA